ncbi:MAG: hypothetical protein FJ290_26800 [Planctomycetes bacterium]|nr:hypothetical protein [Planctomycetota bacterium]
MQMIEHTLDVRGPKVSDGQRSPSAIGWVLAWVEALGRETVSMAFRYTSRERGRPPAWLVAATTVRFADMSPGDGFTRLHFEAPRLGEAAEEPYKQGELFPESRPAPSDTAFDLIGDVVQDIRSAKRDSWRFDAGLLTRVERFGRAPSPWGVDSITLHGDRLPVGSPPAVDAQVSKLARSLRTIIPHPVRARVAGKLDMIRASDGSFGMLLESGESVYGVLTDGSTRLLRELWNSAVVVEGQATFRPSGSLLCLEAEGMAAATAADRFFTKAPKPRGGGQAPLARRVRVRQSATTGASAVYGQWPGDETDEEIAAAMKELD